MDCKVELIQVDAKEFQDGIVKKVVEALKDYVMAELKKEPEKKGLLTKSDIQKMFKVCLSTVNNWQDKGLLKPYSMERKIFYKESEVLSSLVEVEN